MGKSNLVKILESFSPDEFEEFGDYVNSPLFNKREEIVKFYGYLRKYYPQFKFETMDKKVIHKEIFPGSEYRNDFMRNLTYNMTMLAEDYLAFLRFSNAKWEKKRMLVYELNERLIDRVAGIKLKKILTELEDTKEQSQQLYYNKYYFQNENIVFLERKYFNKTEKFLEEAPLEKFHQEFKSYSILTTLKMHVFLLNTKKIFNLSKEIESFDKMVENLDNEFITSDPLIEMYFYLSKLLLTDDEKYYFLAKDKFLNFEKKISTVDKHELVIGLQNFCTRRIRKGEIKFAKEVFELYKHEIENNFYKHHGYIPDVLYKNIIDIGMQIGERDYVSTISEKYSRYLHPDTKEDIYTFGKASIEFYNGSMEKALTFLSTMKLYNIRSKVEVKELLAKIYYETGMENMLYSLGDTFRHLLNNKVITDSRKTSSTNFIKYIKRLYKIRNKSKDISEVRYLMEKEEYLDNRLWLYMKVQELENKARK